LAFLKSLNREQKEAVGLLQVGTFLEYFDFMLYVHMAVVLDEIFFPQTDPHTTSLLTAFAFCSTWVFRPFGALLFGWIGDNIGRKTTVIMTTAMMAVSCMIMANLPTYAQIGVSAAWIVTVCRIVQGLSSMGEKVGAEIYISEITSPPASYAAVSFIGAAAAVGAVAAVGVAVLTTHFGFNWRVAFWIGAGIAVVGSVARTRLRETPEFVDMRRKFKLLIEKYEKTNSKKEKEIRKTVSDLRMKKIPRATLLGYFLSQCGWPISFYLGYIYFNATLKTVYCYTSEDIIIHNFVLTIMQVLQAFIWAFVSFRVHPLKILRIKGTVFLPLILLIPVCLFYKVGFLSILLLQSLILFFNIGMNPAEYVFIKQLPVYKRFTASGLIYALGRASTYIVTSFGVVYLTSWFGAFGTLILTLPLCLGFFWSLNHFEKLEGLRPDKSSNPDLGVEYGKAA